MVKEDLPDLPERAKIVNNFDTDDTVIFGKKSNLEKRSGSHYA